MHWDINMQEVQVYTRACSRIRNHAHSNRAVEDSVCTLWTVRLPEIGKLLISMQDSVSNTFTSLYRTSSTGRCRGNMQNAVHKLLLSVITCSEREETLLREVWECHSGADEGSSVLGWLGLLLSVDWWLVSNVSGQIFGLIFKCQAIHCCVTFHKS
jgi:hypothetical protein